MVGGALREGYRTQRRRPNKRWGMPPIPHACPHLAQSSPAGHIPLGASGSPCPKAAIYPLSLPHRLLFRCNKIMALRLLLSTINIGNLYDEQFLLIAKL